MNNKEISMALNYLLPNAVWTLEDDNYEKINWLSNETKPTLEEVQRAYSDYLAKLEADKAEAAAKKAAAEAKLAALGLTSDDLKALGL